MSADAHIQRNIEDKLIKSNKLTTFDMDELKLILTNPTLKAFYRAFYSADNNTKKSLKDDNEVQICDICQRKYTRHNRARHNRTQIHRAYYDMNMKLHKIII